MKSCHWSSQDKRQWRHCLCSDGSDRQDFELLPSLYSKLIVKILIYCGLSIRESDVVQVASMEEQKENQQQS